MIIIIYHAQMKKINELNILYHKCQYIYKFN